MTGRADRIRTLLLALVVACATCAVLSVGAAAKLGVTWMPGYHAPGTPTRYDKVGVIKLGRASAKNVLVLEPGTSAGAGYFVPLARWIVSRAPGWQVWSVERRENLLEDQSVLNLFKQGKATIQEMFGYYLGHLTDPSIKRHIMPIPDASVGFARGWGLNVAIQDLSRVIAAARKLRGRVVLGGHSLGGSVVTAYATWDFAGQPGAKQLAGLVFDDGGSFAAAESAAAAHVALRTLAMSTPWLAFSGVPAPYLGLFSAVGSAAAVLAPNLPSRTSSFAATPANLKPPVPATNLGAFGFDTDTKTSKLTFAAQAHEGSLDTSVTPAGWKQDGAITPIKRYADMLSGAGLQVDGAEWYFPQRLTDDTAAIGQGKANPAQSVLNVRATQGRRLPRSLRIYAFGAAGGSAITGAARTLAEQSHIPMNHLVLVSRQGTYAHNDPAGAYPHNVFFNHLIPFLAGLTRR